MSEDYGKIKWADIFVTDFDGSKIFYNEIFSWHFVDQFDNEGNLTYSLACLDEKAVPPESTCVVGVMDKGEMFMPSIWGVYMIVADLEGVIQRIGDAGGSIFKGPMEVPEQGRFAVAVDTNGTCFNVWEPLQSSSPNSLTGPNTLSWVELITADEQSAIDFYGAVFGWSVRENTKISKPYKMFMLNDETPVGGLHTRLQESDNQEIWLPGFMVENLDAYLEKWVNLKGQIVFGPCDEPGVGKFAVVADPEGNTCILANVC